MSDGGDDSVGAGGKRRLCQRRTCADEKRSDWRWTLYAPCHLRPRIQKYRPRASRVTRFCRPLPMDPTSASTSDARRHRTVKAKRRFRVSSTTWNLHSDHCHATRPKVEVQRQRPPSRSTFRAPSDSVHGTVCGIELDPPTRLYASRSLLELQHGPQRPISLPPSRHSAAASRTIVRLIVGRSLRAACPLFLRGV